mmetsp:Transcript_2476/g.8825  ORF Transcript_2476/g.8825 Transcript_2476/m.8825 type:complete len:239 (+) Transcript_2476:1324-2040(+)
MPSTMTWLSSSASKSSSVSLTVYTSVCLCWMNCHSTRPHTSSSLASCTSILASLPAWSVISPTSSSNLCSSSASRSSSLNLSSMTNCLPVWSMSSFQWRSRMSGERRSATSGIDLRKFITLCCRPLKQPFSLIGLGSLFTSLTYALVSSSMRSVRMSAHSVVRQSANCTSTSADVSHTSFAMDSWLRMPPTVSLIGVISCGNSKMSASFCSSMVRASSFWISAFAPDMTVYAALKPVS